MISDNTIATEKALLLVTIGFLEALKAGAIDGDEAFHTIGIPSILDAMRAKNVSEDVANLVSQLDELDPLGDLADLETRDASIRDLISECFSLLKQMPLVPSLF